MHFLFKGNNSYFLLSVQYLLLEWHKTYYFENNTEQDEMCSLGKVLHPQRAGWEVQI